MDYIWMLKSVQSDQEFFSDSATSVAWGVYKRNVKVCSSNLRSVKNNFGIDINPIKWMKSCRVYIALGKYIINERKKYMPGS